MKSNSKLKYIILLVICLNCIAICVYINFSYRANMMDDDATLESLRDSIKEFEASGDVDDIPEETTSSEETDYDIIFHETHQTVDDTAVKPQVHNPSATLNFDKLWEVNPEIHAWLEIKGTKIDYPILQSKSYDSKYLHTAFDGSSYVGGALFTQATYNSTDFNDPVTLIYGHTMRSGSMFGQLQKKYSDPASFEANGDILLYLPGEARHYTVFAAVPFDAAHILQTYDFSKPYWYKRFFSDVKRIREIGANFNKEAFPEVGDRVIILSVCLNSDTARRYLVMAVCSEDLADNGEALGN